MACIQYTVRWSTSQATVCSGGGTSAQWSLTQAGGSPAIGDRWAGNQNCGTSVPFGNTLYIVITTLGNAVYTVDGSASANNGLITAVNTCPAPSPSNTRTPTPTPTRTITPTRTVTRSITPTVSPAPCGQLINPNFELIDTSYPCTASGLPSLNPPASGFFDAVCIPGWDTTAPDGSIEIWASGFTTAGAGTEVPSYNGNYFAEINASSSSSQALYQTFTVVTGDTYQVQFAHRGRVGYANTMRVALSGATSGVQFLPGVYVGSTTTWNLHAYNFTATEPEYNLMFSATTNTDGGNFLDAINVVCPSLFVSSSVTPTPTLTPGLTPSFTPTVTPTMTPSEPPSYVFLSACSTGNLYAIPGPATSYSPVAVYVWGMTGATGIPDGCYTILNNPPYGPSYTPTGPYTVVSAPSPGTYSVVSGSYGDCSPPECAVAASPSVTPTNSVTPTVTPSYTPTMTVTPTVTPSYTPTMTITPSITPSLPVGDCQCVQVDNNLWLIADDDKAYTEYVNCDGETVTFTADSSNASFVYYLCTSGGTLGQTTVTISGTPYTSSSYPFEPLGLGSPYSMNYTNDPITVPYSCSGGTCGPNTETWTLSACCDPSDTIEIDINLQGAPNVYVFYDATSLDDTEAAAASESIRSWYATQSAQQTVGELYEGIIGKNSHNGENWIWWNTYPYLGSLTGGTLSDSTSIGEFSSLNSGVEYSDYDSRWCKANDSGECVPRNTQFNDSGTTYQRINRGLDLTTGNSDWRSNGVPFNHGDLNSTSETGPGTFNGGDKNFIVVNIIDEADGLVGLYHGSFINAATLLSNPFNLDTTRWNPPNTPNNLTTDRVEYDYEQYLKVWEDIKLQNGKVDSLVYPVVTSNVGTKGFLPHVVGIVEGETINATEFQNKYGDSILSVGPENLNLLGLSSINVFSAFTATTAYQNLDSAFQNGPGLKNFGVNVDPTVTNFTEAVVSASLNNFIESTQLSEGYGYTYTGTCYSFAYRSGGVPVTTVDFSALTENLCETGPCICPSPTPTPTPTITSTPTTTPGGTPSTTSSVTPTITSSVTTTPSVSVTTTPGGTPSTTSSVTPTITITPTQSVTTTPSVTVTTTPWWDTVKHTSSVTPTITNSVTTTPSITPTDTPASTPSVTPTITPTDTPPSTPSITPTLSVPCNRLINPSFDIFMSDLGACPPGCVGADCSGTTTYNFYPEDCIPGWNTTDSSNIIEIWASGYQGVPSYSGTHFAEINAQSAAAQSLYQDFTAVNGQQYQVQFAHRGRTGFLNTLKVGLSGATSGLVFFPNEYTGLTTSWTLNAINFTASETDYSLVFSATSSQAGGNFLDSIDVVCPQNFVTSESDTDIECLTNSKSQRRPYQ